jgi:hypothetical protein
MSKNPYKNGIKLSKGARVVTRDEVESEWRDNRHSKDLLNCTCYDNLSVDSLESILRQRYLLQRKLKKARQKISRLRYKLEIKGAREFQLQDGADLKVLLKYLQSGDTVSMKAGSTFIIGEE